jgi:hypothetical protein
MGGRKMKVNFTDNSKRVLEEKEQKIQTALEVLGIAAEGYAKQECPVDTGRLRNSISNEVFSDRVVAGTNVEYAQKVEFSDYIEHTNGNAHFLRNAITNHNAEYEQTVKRILES